MNDFHEGDLIEAVKGKAKIGGVVSNWSGGGLGIEDTGWSIEALATHRFTVTVIERAKPALPTEVGAYYDKYGVDVWTITMHHGLMCVANSSSNPEKYAPFTRLEPVAETAKRMRDRLFTEFEESERSYTEDVQFVAAEFGVTGGLGE